MGRALQSGVLLALLLYGAGGAQAQPKAPEMKPAARAHLERGLKLYAEGDFLGASRSFQLGYIEDPRPEFLFAAGQAERKAGDCKKATEFSCRTAHSPTFAAPAANRANASERRVTDSRA